jgi:hypothetical protein
MWSLLEKLEDTKEVTWTANSLNKYW